jgi:WD40 repeat protein
VATGRELVPLRHAEGITWTTGLAWHPDGRRLATACNDRKIHLWDAESANEVMAPWAGHSADGIGLGFNHAGDRLVSTDWGGQTRLWDVATGRLLLTAPNSLGLQFSSDDRLLGHGGSGNKIRLYRMAAGRELRVLRRRNAGSGPQIWSPVPHVNGRTLAAAAYSWVGFFDLPSGEEIGTLQLPRAEEAYPKSFLPAGGWLTTGTGGVLFWPAEPDPARDGVLRVGPPRRLTNVANENVDNVGVSRDGRVLAVSQGHHAILLDRDRPAWRAQLGPQNDIRNVAVSPDGRWVVTCSWWWDGRSKSARIWEAETGRHVHDLPLEQETTAGFSPDNRWLATTNWRGCHLWEIGTWREGRRFDPAQFAFSPDGRLMALNDVVGELRLVETNTGREVARLTGTEQMWYQPICFSPDATRMIAVRKDKEALYVWDLRLIREQLRELGLDWDWPPFPPRTLDSTGGPVRVEVDLGPQGAVTTGSPAQQVALNSLLLALNPFNPLAYLQRGWAYSQLGELRKAVADVNLALALVEGHDRQRFDPDSGFFNFGKVNLATLMNDLAWELAAEPENRRDPQAAFPLAEQAVALLPSYATYWNTLGVVNYRLGRYKQAVEALERSLRLGHGEFAAFDHFFLALCHAQLGQAERARDSYGRAVDWMREQQGKLRAREQAELAAIRAEAETALSDLVKPIP